MGEGEALNAILKGKATIPCTDNYGLTTRVEFKVTKEPSGSCDGCYFNQVNAQYNCPTVARKICCTGGYILIKE